ncbi:hypothetical protein SAMN02745199_1222 [Thermosipho atlanticus DSM 15807]|uniref:Thioredoxin-like [2Fe-2S] ferredoxin n=1 Tax=Thermosipho atlanticus DSM 15807 TaxID=1123380 RepID=A0A1M5T8I0_9BACT|nr:hypothetical protein SAMN02745199_1222 [Thermosipho atlanticus DSM 15807]
MTYEEKRYKIIVKKITYFWVKNMEIKVCMGSSCHLKGAHKIVEKIKKMSLDNLELKGSLCFGECAIQFLHKSVT